MEEVYAFCMRIDKAVTTDWCLEYCPRYHRCDTVADMLDTELKLELREYEEEE